MIELEPRQKLTYAELTNILSILAVRLDNIEKTFLDLSDYLDAQKETELFQTEQILEARMELRRYQNKNIPFKKFITKRMTEIDGSLKGFISFYHENAVKQKPKHKSKYD